MKCILQIIVIILFIKEGFMDIFNEANEIFYEYLSDYYDTYYKETKYYQYHHKGECETPCLDCFDYDKRIYEEFDDMPSVGNSNHYNCDCYYSKIKKIEAGSISKYGEFAPDVFLKNKGKLPDYYITKEIAEKKFGWIPGKNTIAGKAPGFMIGGNIYENIPPILLVKEGRVWYECDVDYISGSRGTCSRLYYSSDGLMFYSDHFKGEVVQII